MGPDSRNRIVNAFRATKALGIAEEKVKPVLKRLLKIYNKNWDLIEEENYRSLLDAIFEYEEAESAKHARSSFSAPHEDNLEEEEVLNEEPERPLKRSCLREQDSHVGTSGTPQSSNGQIDPRDKGKQLVSATPQSSNGQIVLAKDTMDEGCGSLEMASLTCTEGKKVVLSCNMAFEIPNFQMPSLDEVVKIMDEKYKEMYKDLDSQFSVMKVMQDVCHCFLELQGAESSMAEE